jgi:hypothetical protein
MSNVAPQYYPRGINTYVPAMQYSEEAVTEGLVRVNFGSPPVASAAGILSATSIATAVDTSTFATTYTETNMAPYGRTINIVASGAATSNVKVYGEDYLGQPMCESYTLNGTTPVVGKKAFKRVTRVTAGVTGGTTINVGWADKLGLPYVSVAVIREFADNVLQSAGTFVAPIFTDPQTLTTGDPRGTYDPTVTLDDTAVVEIDVRVSDFVNSSGHGGLQGIAHVVA